VEGGWEKAEGRAGKGGLRKGKAKAGWENEKKWQRKAEG